MKLSPSTLVTQTKIRKVFIGCFCALYSLSPVLALTPSTGHPKELNLYTQAREQEEKTAADHMARSFEGFSIKLDKAIKENVELAKFFKKWYCDGCDSVVSPELNQALIEYLGTVPALTKKTAYDFASIVKPHLDPSIAEVSNTDVRALNTLMNIMSDSIIGQTKEQMILSREIAPMGRYYDGVPDNAPLPYDLIADIRSVDSKIYNELPDLWPYKNEDMSAGLIAWLSGEWWSSGIDAGLSEELGIDSLWPVKWVAAISCSGVSCSLDNKKTNTHTIKSYLNKSFITELWGSKKDTLQSIFEWANKFMIDHGANRGNPCITAPSINFFQSNFASDPELLSKMFSMWIYALQEVPELLKWFMNRETRTRESEDKQIDDSIARTFKKRWLDDKYPTKILVAGMKKDIYKISRESSDNHVSVSTTVDALERGEGEYQKYLKYVGVGMEGAFIKEHSIESRKLTWVAMKEMALRAQSFNNFANNNQQTVEYIGDKPECPTS